LSVDGVERVGKGEGFKARRKAEHAWNETRKKKKNILGCQQRRLEEGAFDGERYN
jgi:hypothetical protein